MRVNFLIKLLVFVVLLIVIASTFFYLKNNRIPSERDVLGLLDSLGVANEWKEGLHKITSSSSASVAVYKWTDAKGVVHYENKVVSGAEVLQVNPDENFLPPAPAMPEAPKPEDNRTEEEKMMKNVEKIRAGIETRAGLR
jgi:hypothetical protein